MVDGIAIIRIVNGNRKNGSDCTRMGGNRNVKYGNENGKKLQNWEWDRERMGLIAPEWERRRMSKYGNKNGNIPGE